MIIGGDLNFSVGATESWGPRARVDSLSDFSISNLMGNKLLYIELTNPKPSWRNHCVGEDRIAKRIDIFLVVEAMVE